MNIEELCNKAHANRVRPEVQSHADWLTEHRTLEHCTKGLKHCIGLIQRDEEKVLSISRQVQAYAIAVKQHREVSQ